MLTKRGGKSYFKDVGDLIRGLFGLLGLSELPLVGLGCLVPLTAVNVKIPGCLHKLEGPQYRIP